MFFRKSPMSSAASKALNEQAVPAEPPEAASSNAAPSKRFCVKVLGTGCKKCHTLYENAQEAVQAVGLDAEVVYITDLQKIMEHGVTSVPALIVNDRVVSTGQALKVNEIVKLLGK